MIVTKQQFTLPLWQPDEYPWPAAGNFVPTVTAYLHEDAAARPAVVVCPGGAYCFVSPTEGEPVAEAFFEMGYQAFVVVYTTNPCFTQPLGDQPLNDLARAVRLVRKNAAAWRVLPQNIAVCGFSAGGHLAGSLAVHFASSHILPDTEGVSCRPDAALLCYPVVTFGAFTHADSRKAVLGEHFTQEQAQEMSLELQVSPDTPPVFLWHTQDDETVPVENSLLMDEALRRNGVLHAMHLFATGVHGVALANARWQNDENGTLCTSAQYFLTGRDAIEHGTATRIHPDTDLTQYATAEEWIEAWTAQHAEKVAMRRSSAILASWPQMAHQFLQEAWG